MHVQRATDSGKANPGFFSLSLSPSSSSSPHSTSHSSFPPFSSLSCHKPCPFLLQPFHNIKIPFPNRKSNYVLHVALLFLKTSTPPTLSPIPTLMTTSCSVVSAGSASCPRRSNSNNLTIYCSIPTWKTNHTGYTHIQPMPPATTLPVFIPSTVPLR